MTEIKNRRSARAGSLAFDGAGHDAARTAVAIDDGERPEEELGAAAGERRMPSQMLGDENAMRQQRTMHRPVKAGLAQVIDEIGRREIAGEQLDALREQPFRRR